MFQEIVSEFERSVILEDQARQFRHAAAVRNKQAQAAVAGTPNRTPAGGGGAGGGSTHLPAVKASDDNSLEVDTPRTCLRFYLLVGCAY